SPLAEERLAQGIHFRREFEVHRVSWRSRAGRAGREPLDPEDATARIGQERDAIAPGGWDTLGLPDVPQLLLGPAGHPEAVTWKSPADRPGKRRHAQVRALRTRTHMKGSARPIVDAGAGDLHVRRRRQRRTIRLEPQHPAFDHRAPAGEIEATRAPAGEEAGQVVEMVARRTRSALRRDQQGAGEGRTSRRATRSPRLRRTPAGAPAPPPRAGRNKTVSAWSRRVCAVATRSAPACAASCARAA